MKMKTLLLIAFLVALMALPNRAEAQTATYSTMTTAAINGTQLCFTVASTTNMNASGALTGPGGSPQEWDLWFDGEFTKINTVNTTSNQVCVQRGKSPTRAGLHATAQVVFFGPAGLVPFILSSPLTTSPGITNLDGQFGSCIATQYQFLPLINVANGSIWNCLTTARGGRWVSYGFRNWTTGHPMTNVIDAAYTATLADEFIVYPSLTASRTVTLPAITGITGKTLVIMSGISSWVITLSPSQGQSFGPGGTTSLTQNGAGSVTRLISMQAPIGSWVWGTW